MYKEVIVTVQMLLEKLFSLVVVKANTKKHANSSLYNYVDIDIYMVHYKNIL